MLVFEEGGKLARIPQSNPEQIQGKWASNFSHIGIAVATFVSIPEQT